LEINAGVQPESLNKQHGKPVTTLEVTVYQGRYVMLRRFFLGCFIEGRDIRYYKPAETKNGPLWKNTFTHPKTKRETPHKIYGGKLAGILTQSFCREIFFKALIDVERGLNGIDNCKLIGQFHDEIVLDWQPINAGNCVDHEHAMAFLRDTMTMEYVEGFPIDAEVKSDYRYTK
jgi:hypothetical protein